MRQRVVPECSDAGGKGVPRGGFLGLAPAAEGGTHAAENVGREAIGPEREERVERCGGLVDVFGDAARDELAHQWNPTRCCEGDELTGGESADARPIQERQIVVGGIFGVREEECGELGAGVGRERREG